MSYWLTGLLPKVSTRDMILMRVQALLAANEVIRAVVGDRVVRRQAYVPFASTLTALPLLIVAPVNFDESTRLSRVIKGHLGVGVIVEYQDFDDKLPDGEPSADSLLEEIQRILDRNQLLLLAGETGLDNPCSIARHAFQLIQPEGREVPGGNSTTYYVGLVANYEFRESYPDRLTGVAGQS